MSVGRYGLCEGGGWILGHLIDGVQAEYARIPFADTSVYKIPRRSRTSRCSSSPTSSRPRTRSDVLAGQVKPGDTVAIVGAGPIGLAAVLTAAVSRPARDRRHPDRSRGSIAPSPAVRPRRSARRATRGPQARARADRGGGVDVAIEAVGIPESFELCTDIVRAGGHVANVGVHGKPATLHLERLWIKDITITTGLVDTQSTPRLMRLIAAGKLDPSVFATHRFSLDEAMVAYDAFAAARDSGVFKVVLEGKKHRQLLPLEFRRAQGWRLARDGDPDRERRCAGHDDLRPNPGRGRRPRRASPRSASAAMLAPAGELDLLAAYDLPPNVGGASWRVSRAT